MIKTEYKGYGILFDVQTEEWYHNSFRDKSLKKVMAHIETAYDHNKTCRREVIVILNGLPVYATLTSVLKGERVGWIAFADGSRAQVTLTHVYEITPENEKLVAEIESSAGAVEMLNKEMNGHINNLTRLKI